MCQQKPLYTHESLEKLYHEETPQFDQQLLMHIFADYPSMQQDHLHLEETIHLHQAFQISYFPCPLLLYLIMQLHYVF